MVIDQQRSIKITYLYNQEDKSVYSSLRKYLNSLQRAGLINELIEQSAGASIWESIEQRLEEAQVIILLISPNFDEDDFYNSQEIVSCLKKCVEKGALVWPIIARYIVWEFSSFKDIPVFFGQEKPIMSWSPSEAAYKPIIDKIKEEISYMLSESWVQDGDTYYHQMCFDEALVAYNNSLDFTPDYPPALLSKWRVLRKKGMVEEAKQCLEELLSLDTSLPQKGKDALSLAGQRICLMRSYCKGSASLDTSAFNDAHTAFREVFQRIASPNDKIQKKLCARAYCGEGDTFMSEGRRSHDFANYYNQALDAYQNARLYDSDDPMYLTRIGDVHLALAEAYTRLNDRMQVRNHYYDALENYEQVIRSNPYPPAFVGQGDVYFLLQHFNRALECYESALSYDQYAAQAHGGKGNVLLARNKPEEAVLAFEQALAIDNSDARCHYGKSQALARLKRYQEAFESYNKACHFGIPHSAEFMINYARTLIELGDAEYAYGQYERGANYYTKALDAYQRALQLGGKGKDINYGYGKIWFVNKDWVKALIWFNKALSLDPFMSEAYLGKGKAYLEMGNARDAFDCFKLADKYCRDGSMIDKSDIETTLGDTDYYYAEHCDSKDRDSSLEKACSHYEKAISTRQNAMAYAGLGKTYAAIHRDREAIDTLNHALELMPDLVQCYFIKGNCYYDSGRYSEAYTEYEKAFKSGLDTVPLQKARGEALLNMRRYREAERIFDEVITYMLNNENTYAGKDLAYVYCSKGIALHRQERDEDAVQSFFWAYWFDQSICWEQQYRKALDNIYCNCQKKLYFNSRDVYAHKYKAHSLFLLHNRNQEAINAYTEAINYGGLPVDIFYYRGLVYERLQEYQKAFDDYNEVLRLDPGHQSARTRQENIAKTIVLPQTGLLQKIVFLLKLPASMLRKSTN